MKEYLHKFENLEDFNASYFGNDYYEPWVSLTKYDIPTEVEVILDYSGQPDIVLEYVKKIILDGLEWYLWKLKSDNSSFFNEDSHFVSIGMFEDDFKSIGLDLVEFNNNQWTDVASYSVGEYVALETGSANKVNYNKIYDLVVDFAQGYDGSYYRNGCRIVSAADAIGLGTESLENSAYTYALKSYSSINRNSTKKKIRVRLLNFFGKDVDLTATYNYHEGEQYITWAAGMLASGTIWTFTLETTWNYGAERVYTHIYQGV